jgi:hypothetical protein
VKKTKKKISSQKHSQAQAAVNDMMQQILEEDKYSQKGSIVETDSSDDEDDDRTIYAIASGASSSKRGNYGADATISMLRLDRSTIMKAMRKRLRIEELRGVMDTSGVNKKRANSVVLVEEYNDNAIDANANDDAKVGDSDSGRGNRKKKRKKAKRSVRPGVVEASNGIVIGSGSTLDNVQDLGMDKSEQGDTNEEDPLGADESSIFGQTTGSSNATWVECDKCKKVRISSSIHI